jgi:ATP-dependent exoDNAse (exonuclease V) beta subunit
VIVVEPAAIVEEAVEGQGLRELYVALTRPTQKLVIVHARPLPAELQAESPEDSAGPARRGCGDAAAGGTATCTARGRAAR